MGNKPARNLRQQPYSQMVEDAISALKERPGSTQSDIFQYLEAKYEKKISPRVKRNLESVIRSVIKTKTRGGGRPPTRSISRSRGGFKARGSPIRKSGRSLHRGKVRITNRSLGKTLKKKTLKPFMKTLKPAKKLVIPGTKPGAHRRLLRKAKRGTTRGSKLLLRPARRISSVGSYMSLPRRMNERGRRN